MKLFAALTLSALLAMPILAHAESLTMPIALFVKSKATGFGMYQPRDSNIFKPGDPLIFYVEPQGYTFKTAGDISTFGVFMDLDILSQSGASLASQKHFADNEFTSHHLNRELNLDGTVNLTGAPPGNYLLVLTLHDKLGGSSAVTKLPFIIQ
jgi:hypothetical protein